MGEAFHWKGGWYFERMDGMDKYGSVRVYHLPQDQPGTNVPDVDLEIDPDSWASIVASVSAEGETGFIFRLARALHGC